MCAFLYAPTRLIQEANPEWRLVSWSLALLVLGLTLSALRHFGFRISDFGFSIAFFLVSIPWPTFVEAPLIQNLTRANVAVTIELLGWLGTPAVQHGQVIELSTGVVGIDEACSGIRSFQATLMISLFLGELYRLTVLRRLALCLAGFALSFLFNLGRTFLLTWVASRKGVEAIASWHDPAGVTILVGCFLGLWGVGAWLRRTQQKTPDGERVGRESARSEPSNLDDQPSMGGADVPVSQHTIERGSTVRPGPPGAPSSLECGDLSPLSPGGGSPPSELPLPCSAGSSAFRQLGPHQPGTPNPLAGSRGFIARIRDLRIADAPRWPLTALPLALGAWLLAVELGVEGWYRFHERDTGSPVRWTVAWPTNSPSFSELAFPERTRRMLRYEEGRNATWEDPEGVRWQAIFLRWDPGRIATHLARSHTPEICLTATGWSVEQAADTPPVTVAGLNLPARRYHLRDAGVPLHVFYCLWEERTDKQSVLPTRMTYENRLQPVLAGWRNRGQRSLELAVWGIEDAAQAEAAFREQLQKLVVVEP